MDYIAQRMNIEADASGVDPEDQLRLTARTIEPGAPQTAGPAR